VCGNSIFEYLMRTVSSGARTWWWPASERGLAVVPAG
jgi:hypothetical protein